VVVAVTAGREHPAVRRARLKEEEAAEIARMVAAGELVIRRATPADLARLEAAKKRRDGAAVPLRQGYGERWR